MNFINSVFLTAEYAAIVAVFKKSILFVLKIGIPTFKNKEDSVCFKSCLEETLERIIVPGGEETTGRWRQIDK
jgi:hypothetical protein